MSGNSTKTKKGEKMLTYKGKPLVRCGNILYYGNMEDSHVVMLQFMGAEDFADLKLPTKVLVQLVSTDETLNLKDRIKKRADKANLYEAINIAAIWLERTL